MSGVIHFTSGKTLPIEEVEFRNLAPKLNMKGIKTQYTKAGHLLPLNSMTIEFIEHIEDERKSESAKPTIKETEPVKEPEEVKTEEAPAEKPKEPKKDPMAEMLEKSNCKHEPEKMELYRQHTAKGIRYFPVCSFCGKREKYVSERKIIEGAYAGTPNEKWTEADIADAKPWIER